MLKSSFFVRVVNAFYGLMLSLMCNLLYPIWLMRCLVDALGSLLALCWVGKVRRTSLMLDGVAAEVISPKVPTQCTILYLHGGGYFMGSLRSHRAFASRFAVRYSAQVIVIDDARAPEDPFPAALMDAVRSYKIIHERFCKGPLFVVGDSAGGGLALALGLYLRDHGIALPAGIIALSPWTDLTGCGASVETHRKKDVWLSKRHIDVFGSLYATDAQKTEPYVSPVFGNYAGMPGMLLVVGDHEVLFDDALRIKQAPSVVEGSVHLHIGKGMQHVFPLTLPFLEESKKAYEAIEHFIGLESKNFYEP